MTDGTGGISGDSLHITGEFLGRRLEADLEGGEKEIFDLLSNTNNRMHQPSLVKFFGGEEIGDLERASLFDVLAKIFEQSAENRAKIIKAIKEIDENKFFEEYLIATLLTDVQSKNFYNPKGNKNDEEVANYVYDYLIKEGTVPLELENNKNEFLIKHSLEKARLNRDFSIEQEKNLLQYLNESENSTLVEALFEISFERKFEFREIRILLGYCLEKLFGSGKEILEKRELDFFQNNFSKEVCDFIVAQNEIKKTGWPEHHEGYEYTYERPGGLKTSGEAYKEIVELLVRRFGRIGMKGISACEKEIVFRSILKNIRAKKSLNDVEIGFITAVLTVDPLPGGCINANKDDRFMLAGLILGKMEKTLPITGNEKAFFILELLNNIEEEVLFKNHLNTLEKLSPVAAANSDSLRKCEPKERLAELSKKLWDARENLTEGEKIILVRSTLVDLAKDKQAVSEDVDLAKDKQAVSEDVDLAENKQAVSEEKKQFLIDELVDDEGIVNFNIIGEEHKKTFFEKLVIPKSKAMFSQALNSDTNNKAGLEKGINSVVDKEKTGLLSEKAEKLRARVRVLQMETSWQKKALHANMNRIIGKLKRGEEIGKLDKQFAAYYLDSPTYHLLFRQESDMYHKHHVFCTRKNLNKSLLPSMIEDLGLTGTFKSYTPILKDLFSHFSDQDAYFRGRKLGVGQKQNLKSMLQKEYTGKVATFIGQFFTYSLKKRKDLAKNMEEIKEDLRRELPSEVFQLMEKETIEFNKLYLARKAADGGFKVASKYVNDNKDKFVDLKNAAKSEGKTDNYNYYLACQLIAKERFKDERYFQHRIWCKMFSMFTKEETLGAEKYLEKIGQGFTPPSGGSTVQELKDYIGALKKISIGAEKGGERVIEKWRESRESLKREISSEKSNISSVYDAVKVAEEDNQLVVEDRKRAGKAIGRKVVGFIEEVTKKIAREIVPGAKKASGVFKKALSRHDLHVSKLTDNLNILIETKRQIRARRKVVKGEIRKLKKKPGNMVEIHSRYSEVRSIDKETKKINTAIGKLKRNLKLYVKKENDPLPTSQKGWFGKIKTCTLKEIEDADRLADFGYGVSTAVEELKKIWSGGLKGVVTVFGGFAVWLKDNPEEAENMATDVALLISTLKGWGNNPDIKSLIDDIQSAFQAAVIANYFTRGYGAPPGETPPARRAKGKAIYILACRAMSLAPTIIATADLVTDVQDKGWFGVLTGGIKFIKTVGIKKLSTSLTVDQKRLVLTAIAGYKGGIEAIKRQELLLEGIRGVGEALVVMTSKTPWKAFTSRVKWRTRNWWLKITKEKNPWVKALRIGVNFVLPVGCVVGGVVIVGASVGGAVAAAIATGATFGAAIVPAIMVAGAPVLLAIGIIVGGIWLSQRANSQLDLLAWKTVNNVKDQIIEERKRELTASATYFDEKFVEDGNKDAEKYVKILEKSIERGDDPLFAWESFAINYGEGPESFRKIDQVLNKSAEACIQEIEIEAIKSRLLEKFLASVKEGNETSRKIEAQRKLDELGYEKIDDWEKKWKKELHKSEASLNELREMCKQKFIQNWKDRLLVLKLQSDARDKIKREIVEERKSERLRPLKKAKLKHLVDQKMIELKGRLNNLKLWVGHLELSEEQLKGIRLAVNKNRIEKIKESIKDKFIFDRRGIWLDCYVNGKTIDDLDSILIDKDKCSDLREELKLDQEQKGKDIRREAVNKVKDSFSSKDGVKDENVKQWFDESDKEFNKRLDPEIASSLSNE